MLKELIIKLQEWWTYLLGKWKLIISIAFIGSLLGLGYAFTQKPIYKAEFSFVLEDEKGGGGLGGALGLASQFGLDVGGGGGGIFAGDNLLELMKSRSMVQKALLSPINVNGKNQSLADYYISFREMRNGWEGKPQLASLSYSINADVSKFNRVQDSVFMAMHQEIIGDLLTVGKKDINLSILQVEVNSEDEFFSKVFTEAIVTEVSNFYVETKTKKSKANVAILQFQADSIVLAPNVHWFDDLLIKKGNFDQLIDLENNAIFFDSITSVLKIDYISLQI
jgi:hypothetical protein